MGCEVSQHLLELLLGFGLQIARRADGLHHARGGDVLVQVLIQAALILCNIGNGHILQVAVNGRVQDGNLLFDGDGAVAVLLEHLDDALTLGQTGLGVGVQVRAELGEALQLTILRVNQLQRTGDLFHGLDLGVAANAGNRDAGVDGGADTRVEQLCLKEDLTVGNGNDVRRDIGGNVARLRLDDGQCGQRAAALGVTQLGCAFQQAAVQVENVAGVSLRVPGDGESAARAHGTRQRAWTGHRR